MIAPFGFDVTGFMPRQGSPAVDMAKTGLSVAAEQNAITQRAIENLARQKMTAAQLAFDRDQMAEQARQADMLETGRSMRQEQELQQAAYLDMLKRAEAQRALEGGIVGDATKAFGVGDLTGVEALQQRAKVQAPSLSFQLPGSLPPANEMGIADPFASPMAGLSISRGGETLYSGDTAEMRRRNQEVVQSARGALTGGPEGDAYAPYLAAGIGMAGLGGISGADALKMANAGGQAAALRDASRDNARQISMSRDQTAERANVAAQRDRWGDLDAMARNRAKEMAADVKLTETRANLSRANGIRALLNSDAPLAQKKGLFQEQKNDIKGAMSDYDARRQADAAGRLLAYEQTLNDWLNGGEIPADFKRQSLEALDLMEAVNKSTIHSSGLKAADNLYRSPGFMAQIESPEQAAYFGLQAYQDVTGDMDITDEDYAEEAARIAPLFRSMKPHLGRTAVLPAGGVRSGGGGGASVSMKGDIVDPAIVGSLGGLGSGPVPRIPQQQSPAPTPNPAIERAKQLLGGGGGQ
jgi:hypothetical protein